MAFAEQLKVAGARNHNWELSLEDIQYLSEKYTREFKEVRARQSDLLEELRQLGVISKLEKLVERSIPSLTEYDTRQTRQIFPVESVSKAISEFDSERWDYQILYPSLSYQGVWDKDLILVFSRGIVILGEEETVAVKYTPRGFLTIEGERITLARMLSPDPLLRNEMVEYALLQAVWEPLIPFPYGHPLDQPGYQILHPWELAK